VGALCTAIHRDKGEWALRASSACDRCFANTVPSPSTTACAAALEMCVPTYRFVRRYLDRNPKPPLALRQIDPLIRELTQYRDHIQPHDQGVSR